MIVFRWLARLLGALIWLAVLLPALALVPAAMFDRGPNGDVRPALLPMALGVLDPFVWECARNSLAVAGAVAFGSLVIGIGLGRLSAGYRSWGRTPLLAMVVAPMVVPPVAGALGVRLLLGSQRLAEAGASRVSEVLGPWVGWAGWAWVALTAGVPLVTLAAISALARVDPAWTDAARLEGASRRRIWRQLIWPIVRPEVAKAAAAVFTLTLVEPGAPLVLGLRRTLGFQIVESAASVDPMPRVAILSLVALGLSAAVRVLIHWWGGHAYHAAPDPMAIRPLAAGWGQATRRSGLLLLVAALVWLPSLSVALASISWAPALPGFEHRRSASAFFQPFHDPVIRRSLVNSLGLGLGVLALDLTLALGLAARGSRRGGWLTPLALWPETFPPLVVGVGALAIPWLLRAVVDVVSASTIPAPVGALRILAAALDPARSPYVLLCLCVAAVRLPLLARVADYGRARLRPVLIDAATSLGASSRQARRMATGRWLGLTPGIALLTFALAATNIAPALLLADSAPGRTVGPAALVLAGEPGEGLHEAAVLSVIALVLNVISLGVAALHQSGPIARWFRE